MIREKPRANLPSPVPLTLEGKATGHRVKGRIRVAARSNKFDP